MAVATLWREYGFSRQATFHKFRRRATKTKPENHGSMISRDGTSGPAIGGLLGAKALVEGTEFASAIAKSNKGKNKFKQSPSTFGSYQKREYYSCSEPKIL